jgi:uncharacterized protein YbbC (DUF1343 family)
MLNPDQLSFIGAFPLPLRHGLTIGELASLENAELALGADLHVIQMTDWKRIQWFDFTGQPWVNPSPNIRNLNEAILYPALAMLESSPNYSVGRGTDAPFEQVGADWIDGTVLAQYLTSRQIPGVRFRPVEFTPTASNFSGKRIQGVGIELTDRDAFSATTLGVELALAVGKLHPGKIDWKVDSKLIGSQSVASAFGANPVNDEAISRAFAAADSGVSAFLALRNKYLLYQ